MKSKKNILLGLMLTLVVSATAQVTEHEAKLRSEATKAEEDGWRAGGVTTLNFSQMYFSNWAAGGENSYALNGLVNLFASYRKSSFTWDNMLIMGYGFINQEVNGFRKTDDRFDFTSKVGYRAFQNFFYSGLVNFRTQFTEGFDFVRDPQGETPISRFLAPAYMISALGISYQPNSNFSVFLAPFTNRLTIVNDSILSSQGAFGVTPGDRTLMEFGGYLRANFTKNDFKSEWLRNVTFATNIDLFSNYLHNPQNINVNWETLIALRVNNFLSVNINTHLIWDQNVKFANADTGAEETRVQFRQLLGVGLSYNF